MVLVLIVFRLGLFGPQTTDGSGSRLVVEDRGKLVSLRGLRP